MVKSARYRYTVSMDDTEEAARELDQATAEYRQADEIIKAAREKVRQAITKSLKAGMTPTEVNKRSPFTPAYNRRIAEAAGIEPRPKGPKKEPS